MAIICCCLAEIPTNFVLGKISKSPRQFLDFVFWGNAFQLSELQPIEYNRFKIMIPLSLSLIYQPRQYCLWKELKLKLTQILKFLLYIVTRLNLQRLWQNGGPGRGNSLLDRSITSGRMVCDVKISSKELIRCKSYDLTGLPPWHTNLSILTFLLLTKSKLLRFDLGFTINQRKVAKWKCVGFDVFI